MVWSGLLPPSAHHLHVMLFSVIPDGYMWCSSYRRNLEVVDKLWQKIPARYGYEKKVCLSVWKLNLGTMLEDCAVGLQQIFQ